jgi:hypothetical protein
MNENWKMNEKFKNLKNSKKKSFITTTNQMKNLPK